MPTTTTITKGQRAGIYELVRNHLAFAEDVDLLADIGWRPDEERESFELTMPVHDLAELLNRLHDEAERMPARSCSSTSTRGEAIQSEFRQDKETAPPRRAGRPGTHLHAKAQR